MRHRPLPQTRQISVGADVPIRPLRSEPASTAVGNRRAFLVQPDRFPEPAKSAAAAGKRKQSPHFPRRRQKAGSREASPVTGVRGQATGVLALPGASPRRSLVLSIAGKNIPNPNEPYQPRKTVNPLAEMTPMMKQYLEMKERNPDAILFFRLGDFYEMFFDDAKLASKELDLTLTTRDRNKPPEERTPMCGVPYHSCDSYIARLIAKGYKVAICEQTEDPATAKGLVDRDIIRIVTPGTVIAASMLEEGKNNFLAAIYAGEEGLGLCLCDISTGEIFATSFLPGAESLDHLENELGRFRPREAVLSPGAWAMEDLREFLTQRLDCMCQGLDQEPFTYAPAWEQMQAQFRSGLDSLPQGDTAAVSAAGGLLHYLYQTQKTDLGHIAVFSYYAAGQFMELDLTARQTLELTETLRSKEKKGSLLWVLDKTKTAMGGRLMRGWLQRPLLSPVLIARRQQAVSDLVEDIITREELSLALREVTDLERLIGRVVYGSAGGRDLAALAVGLGKLPHIRELLSPCSSALLQSLAGELDDLPQLRETLQNALVDEPPFSVREGKLIREGYDPQVDRLRSIIENGGDLLADLERRTKEETGIKNMKVGYNKVFGYYIEVAKSQSGLVPQDWVRKQTTVNSERYISQELKELEHTILSAQDQVVALEYQLFCSLREQVCEKVSQIQASAAAVAQVDVLNSFAVVAAANNYCMPQVDSSASLRIVEGRHPVVEKMLKNALFVPNDTHMDDGDDLCAIITGPNMAGKSTYMRQVALIVLMAQMGSVHLHGGDDRGGPAAEKRHPPLPAHSGRDRPGHQHLRRHGHCPLRGGVLRRQAPPGLQDPLCHPLPRAHRAGGGDPRGEELQHRRQEEGGRDPLPAEDRPGRGRPELRHRGGQAGRGPRPGGEAGPGHPPGAGGKRRSPPRAPARRRPGGPGFPHGPGGPDGAEKAGDDRCEHSLPH